MPNQLAALPQGTAGNGIVLAVNDRLRRVAQSADEATTAAANAQTSADGAQSSANAAQASSLQISKNLLDVGSIPTARANLDAVSRTEIVVSLGTASATYNVAQINLIISTLNEIITALNA